MYMSASYPLSKACAIAIFRKFIRNESLLRDALRDLKITPSCWCSKIDVSGRQNGLATNSSQLVLGLDKVSQ